MCLLRNSYLHRGVSSCQWFTVDRYGHWQLAAGTLRWWQLWIGWCHRQSWCCCRHCRTFHRWTPVICVQLTIILPLSTVRLTAFTAKLSLTFSTNQIVFNTIQTFTRNLATADRLHISCAYKVTTVSSSPKWPSKSTQGLQKCHGLIEFIWFSITIP